MPDTDEYDVLVAAARHQVDLLPVEDLPMLAAEWLCDGLDTPTLRELAGLRRDERSAAGLWPDVLAELGVSLPVPDPRRVLAPWAARLVLGAERGPEWLVQHLLRGIPFDDVDDLVLLLYELDHCLETLAQPYARRVHELAGVLAEARAEVDRIVWLLARLDPRANPRPLPPLARSWALTEAAVRAVRDDLRRVTSRRWSLERVRPDEWVLTSPQGSGALQLDSAVDEEALPPGIRAGELQQEFVDEAIQHVGERVLDALADHGTTLRCRAHAASLTVCAGQWMCDSRAAHDVADVGSLRRADAEVVASSDS